MPFSGPPTFSYKVRQEKEVREKGGGEVRMRGEAEEGGKKRGGRGRRGREKEEVGRPDHTVVSPGCSGPGSVHLEILYTKSFRTPGS